MSENITTEQDSNLHEREFPLTTIKVTDTDGDVHTWENAAFLGIWSGHAIINEVVEQVKTSAKFNATRQTVHSHWIEVKNIARLELGAERDYSATRGELEAPGHLSENDELNMDA